MKHSVVIGSPGTGKTRHLVEVTRNFDLRQMRTLYCSHTRAAAQEAVTRWGKPSQNLTVSTLHSFAFNLQKLVRNQVIDDEMSESFGEALGLAADDTKACFEIYNYARAVGQPIEAAFEHAHAPVSIAFFKKFCEEYKEWKDDFGLVDFSDMLERAATAPEMPKFDGLVVDEAQDLTPLHWSVVSNIVRLNPGIRCVIAGDGNQALYEWSGADPHGMDKFLTKHGGELRELEQSHRVPRVVHALALRVAGQLKAGGPTNYRPRDAAGRVVTSSDFDYLGDFYDPNRESLILYSNAFVRAEVEEELRDAHILYTALGGQPAPAQTRAGQAMIAAQILKGRGVYDAGPMEKVHRGLTPSAARIWTDHGPLAILKKLWGGDVSQLNIRDDDWDYFLKVDWTRPITTRIATIHGAKGHEAQDVHLVNSMSTAAVDHAIQNADASHRVAYVAVTRASENLFIYNGDQPYEFPT